MTARLRLSTCEMLVAAGCKIMTKHEGSSNDRKLNVIVLIVIPSSLHIRHSSFLKRLTIRVVNLFAPKNENHFLDLVAHGEKFAGRFKRNLRGFFNWIAV